MAGEQVDHRLRGDVGRDEPKRDGHRALCAPLGGLRQRAATGEPPHNDQTGQTLDCATERPAGQRDRPGCEALPQADTTLDAHPHQTDPRQPARPASCPQPAGIPFVGCGRGFGGAASVRAPFDRGVNVDRVGQQRQAEASTVWLVSHEHYSRLPADGALRPATPRDDGPTTRTPGRFGEGHPAGTMPRHSSVNGSHCTGPVVHPP